MSTRLLAVVQPGDEGEPRYSTPRERYMRALRIGAG